MGRHSGLGTHYCDDGSSLPRRVTAGSRGFPYVGRRQFRFRLLASGAVLGGYGRLPADGRTGAVRRGTPTLGMPLLSSYRPKRPFQFGFGLFGWPQRVGVPGTMMWAPGVPTGALALARLFRLKIQTLNSASAAAGTKTGVRVSP